MVIIDGVIFNIPVVELSRKADFLDKFAKRTDDGELQRELIGVYFNYQLKFDSVKNDTQAVEYQRLWDKLTEPVEFHTVTLLDEKGEYTFKAYFSNISDGKKNVYKNYWHNLTVNFTAQVPARS